MKKVSFIFTMIFICLLLCLGLVSCNETEFTEGALTFIKEEDGYYVSGIDKDAISVVIPDTYRNEPVVGVAEINGGFSKCKKLRHIVIGNNVVSIRDNSFKHCTSLESIFIPKSVVHIGEYMISSSDNTIVFAQAEREPEDWEILWSANNRVIWNVKEYGTTENGIKWAITNDKPNEVLVCGVINGITNVIIPDTINDLPVTTIDNNAFYRNSNITSVIFGKNVTEVKKEAFSGCGNIEIILIPSNINKIGGSAFLGYSMTLCCEAENKPIDWDDGWTSSSSTVIWNVNKYGITENGIKWAVTNDKPNEALVCGGIYGITNVIIPDAINDLPVTTIVDFAFEHNETIESVIIGNNVISIGESAFYSCYLLRKVELGEKLVTIGESAFHSCGDIEDILIPSSVAEIGKYAFSGNNRLTAYCNAEKKPSGWSDEWISWRTAIAWNVKEYGITEDGIKWAITNDKPNEVVIAGGSYGMKSAVIPKKINDKVVTTIVEYAFMVCRESLEEIVIPSEISTIGDCAFNYCYYIAIYCETDKKPSGWSDKWIDDERPIVWSIKEYGITEDGIKWAATHNKPNEILITGVTMETTNTAIPKTINDVPVTTITEHSFCLHSNSSIRNIVIPNNIVKIEECAFSSSYLTVYCEAEKKLSGWSDEWTDSSLTVEWGVKEYGTTEDGINWIIIKDKPNEVLVYGVAKWAKSITIPNQIKGLPVTAIAERAFFCNQMLRSLIIGENITEIKSNTIRGCNALELVVIPSSVTTISDDSITFCDMLTVFCKIGSKPNDWSDKWTDSPMAVVWNVKEYGTTENGINWLTTRDKPNEISVCSFMNGVTNVVIPDTINGFPVTALIGERLSKNETIESVVIGNNVTSMTAGAFSYCTRLKNIVIGNGIATISEYSFSNCNSLERVVVGKNVSTIGEWAFSHSGEYEIVIPTSLEKVNGQAFYYCNNVIIYYEGTMNPSSIGITNFRPHDLGLKGIYLYSESEPTTGGNYWHYVDGEIVIWE